MTIAGEQPTLEERWHEHQILLEVFKMCSWGGLEIYFEPPPHPEEPGTLYLQATAMPPDEMLKPAEDRRTVVSAMAFNVHYGAPPLIEERRRDEKAQEESIKSA